VPRPRAPHGKVEPVIPEEFDMPADETNHNEDLKAKMREALERKRSNQRGGSQRDHAERGQAQAHGPASGKREFRRKTG
jgi:hypothetical protein